MSQGILDIISKELAEDCQISEKYHPTEVVEFRLTRAGMVDPSSGNRVVSPALHQLPGRDMIIDRFDKKIKNKLIRNITGYNPVPQKPGQDAVLDPIEGPINFIEGSVFVQPHELDTWLFLKLHNKFRDNINRNPKKNVVFFEVNEVKEIMRSNNSFLFKHLASALIINADPADLAEIAITVRKTYPEHEIDAQADHDKLLAAMISIAETRPDHIILAIKEPTSLARILADEAVNRRDIMFDETQLQWIWKRSAGEKGKKNIIKLEKGNVPIKGLVDYITSPEGSEHFTELKLLGDAKYYPKPR